MIGQLVNIRRVDMADIIAGRPELEALEVNSIYMRIPVFDV